MFKPELGAYTFQSGEVNETLLNFFHMFLKAGIQMQLWLTKSQQSFTPWRTLGYFDSYLLSLLLNILVVLWASNSLELCPFLWLSQFYSSGQHWVLVNLVPSRPPSVEGSSRMLLTPILKTHQFQREVLKWADRQATF